MQGGEIGVSEKGLAAPDWRVLRALRSVLVSQAFSIPFYVLIFEFPFLNWFSGLSLFQLTASCDVVWGSVDWFEIEGFKTGFLGGIC